MMIVNAGSLVGTTLVTSGLGFVYWWAAARLFPPDIIGFSAAAISAMTLLGTVGMVGLGTLLMRELPRRMSDAGGLIMTALLIAAGVSSGLGLLFAVFAPRLSAEFIPLSADGVSLALFVTGVMLTAVTLVLDQVLLGVLRGGTQLMRNTLFALAKLLLLVVAGFSLATNSGMVIYGTWALGILLSLGVIGLVVAREHIPLSWFRPNWALMRGLRRAALSHHALNLALQAPGLMLPVVVTALLSSSANASFYTAWMIAAFVFVAPNALTTMLYVVGSADPVSLPRKVRQTLKLSLLAGAGGSLFLVLFADVILNLFGRTYADEAVWCLRILALGVFPLTVRVHFIAIRRIEGHILSAARLMAFGGGLELLLAALGGSMDGLTGLSIGWVGAICVEAALTALPVYLAASGIKTGDTHAVEPHFAG
jgi:O-antigen/teichoic acid export membrane protein